MMIEKDCCIQVKKSICLYSLEITKEQYVKNLGDLKEKMGIAPKPS